MGAAEAPAWGLLSLFLVFSFIFLTAWQAFFRATLGPALRKVGNTGFGGIYGHGGVHPLRFLVRVADSIDGWTTRGLQGSERGVVYSFNKMIDTAALFIGIPLAIALALYELATWAKHEIGHAISRPEHAASQKAANDRAKGAATITRAQFNKLGSRVDSLAQRVNTLAHAHAGAIATPFPRIGHLEKKVTEQGTTLDRLLRQGGSLRARTHRIEKLLAGGAVTGLLVAALARMGFGFLKCSGWQRVGRRITCGMSRFLESLLAFAIDALVITHLCETTKLLTRLGVAVQPMIVKLTTGVAELMLCQGAGPLPSLPLPAFTLPDVEGDGLPL